MTTLNVVIDEVLSTVPTGLSRYSEELTRALIRYAPPGCFVEGIVSSSPEQDYQSLTERLPGLTGLFKSALTRRDLRSAWQHGFTPVPSGMIHAPSLFAPLRNHDRVNTRGSQITVTIHDVAAWTHPDLLPPRQVSWTRAMAQRAFKYADAIVVPTHAVAAELEGILGFGDRVRVLGAAVGSTIVEQSDEKRRAERLGLPERYLLTTGNSGPGSGIPALLDALASLTRVDIPLIVAGTENRPGAVAAAVSEAGLPPERVVSLPDLSDADLSVVLARATAFVYPTVISGFGMPMLEAFRFGRAVIHSDAAALVEVAGDAGLSVPAANRETYPLLLAEAIENVLADDDLRNRLGVLGTDRANLFSWRAPAEGVWQLQADL
jgi:glycosyltransferase involved in cell wall biosynthesis